ncbi:MAG: hypothetical protein KC546_23305, partial [Anaerolineae bacterium]|nr:hypothetical protein [Anaerolineae bacterium]
LYVNIPGFIFQRVGRWMMNDKDFQIQYLRYLSRAIDPKDFRPNPSPVVFIKGFLADLRSAFS